MYHFGVFKLSDKSKQLVSLEKYPSERWWKKNFKAIPQHLPGKYLSVRIGVKNAWGAYRKGESNQKSLSISTNGYVIYSYGTVILTRDPEIAKSGGPWEVYAIPGNESQKIYLNTRRYSKTTSSQQNGLRRLLNKDGYFRLAEDLTWGNQIAVDYLTCYSCDGTGGEDQEISGGEKIKKECKNCGGSGMDPQYVKEFEDLAS